MSTFNLPQKSRVFPSAVFVLAALVVVLALSLAARPSAAWADASVSTALAAGAVAVQEDDAEQPEADQVPEPLPRTIADGIYSISSAKKGKMVLDVAGASGKNKAPVVLFQYGKSFNQKYSICRNDDGYYTIQAVHSGKYLATFAGKAVQAKSGKSKAAQWNIMKRAKGYALVNRATGTVMSVAATANSTPVDLVPLNGKSSQRFTFTKRAAIEDGMYIMRSCTGARALDVSNASKSDGANALLWEQTGNNNQKFQVKRVSGDYYKIFNVNSEKALQVAGNSKKAGANVEQGTYAGKAGQLWKARVSEGGGIAFASKRSGRVLGVDCGRDANGTNVQIEDFGNLRSQSWRLVPTERKPTDVVLDRAQDRANLKTSATNYLITVDTTNHRVVVFQRSGNAWQPIRNCTVSTGAPSTPTPTGDYTIGMRGYSFGYGYTCYYWTQFRGPYYFHSVLYNQGTRTIQDGRLGYSISHGCVRMDIDDAYWINQNIPSGTKVTIYR